MSLPTADLANAPVKYAEFIQRIKELKRSGIIVSQTGDKLLAADRGRYNLQGHVRQAFYGTELFLLAHPSLVTTIAASDVNKQYRLDGNVLRMWKRFLSEHRRLKGADYDLGTLRTILPTHLGGKQTSGGGAIAFIGRSLPLVAQMLLDLGKVPADVSAEPEGESTRSQTARRKESVLRIVRDTKIIRDLKVLYNSSCQVCGYPPVRLSKTQFYAEGHHLRPLGKPHNGRDEKGNVLVVCPNHHVLLDRFAMTIDPDDCRSIISMDKALQKKKLLLRHRLSKDNVKYHSQRFRSIHPGSR
jgi:hypothetical protein